MLTMKKMPQKIDSIEEVRERVSSLFRVEDWKGYYVKLKMRNIIKSMNTTKA